ncbi:DUF3052 family protein [Pseudoluteimonas lycopersici]|uniref:DUF3052 family protein n=1 Tax=Pseudoluteimonas lycopersici TaxID=1324796 RepID=A0A516V672_9GAMM|nr:DUF3052 family protein [Lysobacter lycopersici]QDQ74026.1 DUF3052 family protein [Lysobacter lycopersici]
MAGYSGTPLPKKLGLAPGMRVCAIGCEGYVELVGAANLDLAMQAKPGSTTDLVHLFATRRGELEKRLPALRKALQPDAVVWVSWPKKASKVQTDIVEDTIREIALPLGFVDVKVCAVDAVWSGLKLVVRKDLR